MTDLFSKYDDIIATRENLLSTGVTDPFSLVMEKVEEEAEIPVLFKLSFVKLDTAKARLAELHPYDEPAILHWQAGTTQGYAAWLDEQH